MMTRWSFTRYPHAAGARQYAIAVFAVIGALLLKVLLNPLILGDSPFLIFFAAVTVSAWYGGFWPGMLATVLATIFSAAFFLSPIFSLSVGGIGNQAQLALFLIEGGVISALSDALRSSRRQAEEALRTRDLFLAVAAHELKTPLTVVIGYTQVLRSRVSLNGGLPERERRIVHTIDDQARRLYQLIESLLDLSRIHNGRLSIERRAVNVVGLVRQVVEATQLILDRHTIELHTANDPILVEGDELRLQQVVQNLLQNAIKYSPDGGVISVTIEQRDQQVCIGVSDPGIGIPETARDQLFQRYYRADNGSALQVGGMGIGLYIVREIVTLHEGSVELTRSGETGSTFTVCLPRLIPPVQDDGAR